MTIFIAPYPKALRRFTVKMKTSLINTKLGDFVNLGVLFLTIWINTC